MRTFIFNKLVRDKITEHQQASGAKSVYRVLKDTEYLQALKDKILEESAELNVENPEELMSELADIQEVIDSIVEAVGKSKDDIATAQAKKNAKNGSFKNKLFVEKVTVLDDDPWVEYYLKNADRYPEIKR